MSFIHFIKLLLKNIKWLLLFPLVLAFSIYYFTRGEKKIFSSETVIYTGIASGYSLNGDTKADFFATGNAFDNLLTLILSRDTKQEVVIGLLAEHLMLKKHDPTLLSWGAFSDLKKSVPDSIRNAVVKNTLDETIAAITSYLEANGDNALYKLINSDNPYYSFNALQNIKAVRVSSSDVVKISYETTDAAICKNTLDLLTTIFMKKHRLLKEGQTGSVIVYFEKETHNAYLKLDSIEQIFLDFNKRNDIINYYEQTKAVANEKENLDAQNHGLEMEKMANSKTLAKVDDNIKGRTYQIKHGTDVVKQREKLAGIYTSVELSKIVNKPTDVTAKRMADSLQASAEGVEKDMRATLNNLYTESNMPNGIPTKEVLDEWLKTTLLLEQSKARLTVMDKRKKEFIAEYHRFAPLGATLKKVERQINVAEQAYLELLHGLSLARLAQQNNELTSKLTIVDPPFLPLKPNPSKRATQIIVGFLAGAIMMLAFVLAKALLNKNVQQPVKANRLMGLPLLGIYPLLNESPQFIAKANFRLTQQLLATLIDKAIPVTIGFISMQQREGKSTIIDMLHNKLTALNYKVEIQPWHKEKLIIAAAGTQIILIEFPALDNLAITPGMLPSLQHIFLVCRANRTWTTIDKQLLNTFTTTQQQPLQTILNGVDATYTQEYIGEAPAKNNKPRWYKKRKSKTGF